MTLEIRTARVWLEGTRVAESSDALIVKEQGRSAYPPVAYFPRSALEAELTPLPKRTSCPLKGTASYFDLTLGATRVSSGVWTYDEVLSFDPKLEALRGRVAFDAGRFRVEIDG